MFLPSNSPVAVEVATSIAFDFDPQSALLKAIVQPDISAPDVRDRATVLCVGFKGISERSIDLAASRRARVDRSVI